MKFLQFFRNLTPVPLWHVGLAIALSFNATLLLKQIPLGDYLVSTFSHSLVYRAREMLDKSPTFEPRIKVFVLDDRTTIWRGRKELNIVEWTKILEFISRYEPKHIFIDKIFSMIGVPDEYDSWKRREKLFPLVDDAFAKLKIPVIIGSAALSMSPFPKKIDNNELKFKDRSELHIHSYLKPGLTHEDITWMQTDGSYQLGPHYKIADNFSKIGHINTIGGIQFQPFLRHSNTEIIPHIGLFAAEELQVDKRGLKVNSQRLYLDDQQRAFYNFIDFGAFENRTSSLIKVFAALQKKEAADSFDAIQKGDTVVILPEYSTGHTDWVKTPLGLLPGGVLITSVINSAMTNQWIAAIKGEIWIMLAFTILGAVFGGLLGARLFWPALIISAFALMTCSITAFVYAATMFAWLFPAMTMTMAGIIVHVEKTRIAEKSARSLRQALEGAVDQDRLEKIIDHPEQAQLKPCSRTVTIMFVDIVGFSLLSETQSPEDAFTQLKRRLTLIADIVHRENGVVDKTLGDGLLAFFGYHYSINEKESNHAEEALRCAAEIQNQLLTMAIIDADQGQNVYPLRIGINTASVYFGDLGGSVRIDPTVIGHGVNYAKRLEESSEPFSVMVGPTTFDMVQDVNIQKCMAKKLIKIKHHDEVFEAYEFDPLAARDAERLRALNAYRTCAKMERREERWSLEEDQRIVLESEYGSYTVNNFSRTGFAIVGNRYLARGISFLVEVSKEDPLFQKQMEAADLKTLTCEVRWGRSLKADLFMHGVLLKNLNEQQLSALQELLRLRAHKKYEGSRKVI